RESRSPSLTNPVFLILARFFPHHPKKFQMSPYKIRIGITGYGNLGRGAEVAISQQPDMELVAVFSRRDPSEVSSSVPAVHYDEIASWQDRIDVMLLCGGSARDLPVQTPEIARWFHTVDSYDTHAK